MTLLEKEMEGLFTMLTSKDDQTIMLALEIAFNMELPEEYQARNTLCKGLRILLLNYMVGTSRMDQMMKKRDEVMDKHNLWSEYAGRYY